MLIETKVKIRLLSLVLLLSTIVVSAPSHAVSGIVKGTVEYVRVHDGTQMPNMNPPRFWFTLNGVSSAGGCPVWVGGRVLFLAESKEAYVAVVTAHLTGQEIALYYDDTVQVSGLCLAGYITIGNPPPLF